MAITHTIGRRKTSIARVYLEPGNGAITVNKRDFKEYFPTGPLQYIVTQAQLAVNAKESFDIKINVDGGGITGQAEASSHGDLYDPALVLSHARQERVVAVEPTQLV